jgi:septal ring factor EnvC (AmiA/AmiB activator)
MKRVSDAGSPARTLALLLAAWLLATALCCPATSRAADDYSKMEKQLALEKRKAADRKKTLQRLTENERKLNANLADAEKRIIELEKGIADQQSKLLGLSLEDKAVRKEYDALLKEQAKTEKAQAESLRLLWDVTMRRMAVGSRDMVDWAGPDREYAWSRELYAALEGYRKELDQREAKLTELLGIREKLSQEMEERLEAIHREKSELLRNRVSYDRQLSELRRERGATENELNAIMTLVDSLNFELSRRGPVDIAKLRGKLPWPVTGKLRKRYAPGGSPAVRGLGFSADDRSAVRAVAAGTVVHNDILRGFGTVVIIQHDKDYFTLYAFLGSSPMRVGDQVRGGQQLGTVGFYPAIEGPGLYFELRYKQNPINPEQWFTS